MPRKKKPLLTFAEKVQKIKSAQLSSNKEINRDELVNDEDNLILSLSFRIKQILGLTDKVVKNSGNMMFFVMYDIEDNKVRHLIFKYLERKGCVRIQRSIFLADLLIEKYDEIKNDLAEVQAAYDNHDSIIILPISTDYLRMMKIIGQKIEVDVITHSKNTLFF